MKQKQKQKGSPLKTVVFLTLIIFAILSVLLVVNSMKSDSNKNKTTFEKQPPIDGQPVLGDVNAPVTVVEFGDFKCPACKAWGESIYPQLINDYVNTGNVKFAYINVLFHGEQSKLGSLAAESVYKQSPESYWSFHKELFKAQPSDDHHALWITNDKIVEIASAFPDIDLQQLQEDITNQTELEELNKDTKLVEEYNVQLTPTIMVNGIMLEDPFDYEKIKSLIENELEGK
ncbi:DsbA family protein [Litchfieldia alkalitelluris]|uniref:DsbA family protein n=1 Tax=Litchfieldia alkalitelluris TaxID=304268 RepID=UPI000996D9C9|nr:DsbA family protein [Litchfieldia alkalitelluris]